MTVTQDSVTQTWKVFAFDKRDESRDQRRGGIPSWRLPQAVEWAVARGFDTVLIEQSNEPLSSSRLSTHHVCADSRCPGGCE